MCCVALCTEITKSAHNGDVLYVWQQNSCPKTLRFLVGMFFTKRKGNVKLSLCLIKHYVMKAYGGIDV
jgi:hypothetical protein